MKDITDNSHERSVGDYVVILRRRKWIVLQALILVPVIAVVLSLRQQKLYRASSAVLIASTATGVQSTIGTGSGNPDRNLHTQAEIAATTAVAQRVLRSAHVTDRTPGALIGQTSFSPESGADVLDISVTDGDPAMAAKLATEYAVQYAAYRRTLDTIFVHRARLDVENRLRVLRQSHDTGSPVYLALAQKDQQLLTIESLQTASALVLRTASGGVLVQPKPTRNAVLGLGVGLLIGAALALIWDAVDTRVRSATEISNMLGQPLLARIPAPTKKMSTDRRLVMLSDAGGVQAEAFRLLRTNLDFANLERGAHTIMVTSAVQAEGKSTTAANLALALARVGRRVVLVDLDLRRPIISKFFDLHGRPGLTEVALGAATLDDALAAFPVTHANEARSHASNGGEGKKNGNGSPAGIAGMLEVLPSGPIPPDPGEFVTTSAVRSILAELRERADVVIVDAPPLLGLGDAVSMSRDVDAVLTIVRLGAARRPALREARRVLESLPTTKLGFVITGAELEEGYGNDAYYAYSYYYTRTESHAEETHDPVI